MQLFDDSTLKRAEDRGAMPAQWPKTRAAIIGLPILAAVTARAMMKQSPDRLAHPPTHL
jgi:hypothetical protein